MSSTTNNFITVNGSDPVQESTSVVTVNLYGSSTGRRRRLSEAIEYESTECFPYLISMTLGNASAFSLEAALDEEYEFPSCTFWNTNSSEWSGDGCFVYDITNHSVICGCTHLT